jgi:hypothetical protein
MKKSLRPFFGKISLLFLVFFALFLVANFSLAADATDLGVDQIDSTIELTANSPITIAVKVIQIILGLLGIIAVSLVIYGGFLWTSSGGSEDKINQAKKLLRNAVIGLIIILSSWGITYFVMAKLLGVTGTGNGQMQSGPNNNNFSSLSLGTLGSCSIETVYPTPNSRDVARNSSILVTSKEPFVLETVCVNKDTKSPCACDNTSNCNLINPENIQIFKTADGNSCTSGDCSKNVVNFEVSVPVGNKTLILKPLGFLGNSDGNVEYGVRLTNDIKKFGGEALFSSCSSDYLEWNFETSNKLDLESPQVVLGGFFPPIDSQEDIIKLNSEAKAAQAKIVVTGCPRVYEPAKKVSITKIGSSVDADFVVNPKYSGVITDFTIQVATNDKAKLFSGGSLLGSSDIIDNKAVFDDYFTLSFSSVVPGNSWNLSVLPVQAAEKLTVASSNYIFVSNKSGNNNEILVPESCSPANMAVNMELVLSSNSEVSVTSSGGIITLFSKNTGISGNSLTLTSNGRGLALTKFTGGADKSDSYEIRDVKDKPMNSVIQVNFSEAMNPMIMSGSANELSNYIRLVNADSSSKTSGQACSKNSDCLSYDCQGNSCAGDFISGDFSLNNSYRTLEFISDKECGVNSCGEKMYCLPAGSHLALKINAAKLKSCSVKSDCDSSAPYSECLNNICRDSVKELNYPVADSLNLNGAVDLAFNSLDGNRDGKTDGPIGAYPYFNEGSGDLTKRDGFEFSFFVSNQINSVPPSISLTSPRLDANNVTVLSPVLIDFNDLMMVKTLRTGSVVMDNGLSRIEHKLINLRSSNDKPLGYWLESENKEIGTPDGQPDYTSLRVAHSDFFEAVTYISQIGSGVKNIYQNCFKPSIGPDCLSLDETNPSCCFGSGTNLLDSNGNCVN